MSKRVLAVFFLAIVVAVFLIAKLSDISEQARQDKEESVMYDALAVRRSVDRYIKAHDGQAPERVSDFISFLPESKKLDNVFSRYNNCEPRDWNSNQQIPVSGGIYYVRLTLRTYEVLGYGAEIFEPIIRLGNDSSLR